MAGSKFRDGRLASLASAIDFLEIAPWNHFDLNCQQNAPSCSFVSSIAASPKYLEMGTQGRDVGVCKSHEWHVLSDI
jgi:hypothetical protein